jgi:hypothetical protein
LRDWVDVPLVMFLPAQCAIDPARKLADRRDPPRGSRMVTVGRRIGMICHRLGVRRLNTYARRVTLSLRYVT